MAINLGVGATLSDTQVQLQQLLQRKAIADALMKQGLSQGSPTVDAGVLKVANFGDPITKVINAFAGQSINKDVNADQADLMKQQQGIQQKGLNDYFTQRQGSIDTNQPGPPTAEGVGPAPRINQPDALGAIKSALGSQDPLLTQIGMSDLSTLNKGTLTPKDYLELAKYYDPESAKDAAQGGGTGALKSPIKQEKLGPTDTLYSGRPGETPQPIVSAKPAGEPGPIPGVPGVNGQKGPDGMYHTLNPPNNQNINLSPRITNEAFRSGQGQVEKGYEQFNTGVSTLQNISTAQTALQDISAKQLGPLSDYQQYANALGAKFGFSVPKAASVEALNSALGENLINVIRKFAPVSDTDAARALKIVGSSGNIKEALESILNQQAHSIGTQMDQYQKLVQSNSQYLDTPEAQAAYRQQWFPSFDAHSGYTPLNNPQGEPNPDASLRSGGTVPVPNQLPNKPNVKNWADLPG